MSSASSASVTRARATPTDLALVAFFAALIAAAGVLPGIPTGSGVNITLQSFAVALSGACLGPIRGFLATTLYVLVGAAGLPVFTGGVGGLGVFSGGSVGYLLAFPLAAALVGFLVMLLVRTPLRDNAFAFFLCALAGSVIFIHPMGIAGMHWRLDLSWGAAIKADMVFWFGDIVKCAFVALIAPSVHRAFPDLLGPRR